VISRRSIDEPRKALKCLKASLEWSDKLGDHTGDADVLGSIADLYVEVGDFDRAGKVTPPSVSLG